MHKFHRAIKSYQSATKIRLNDRGCHSVNVCSYLNVSEWSRNRVSGPLTGNWVVKQWQPYILWYHHSYKFTLWKISIQKRYPKSQGGVINVTQAKKSPQRKIKYPKTRWPILALRASTTRFLLAAAGCYRCTFRDETRREMAKRSARSEYICAI